MTLVTKTARSNITTDTEFRDFVTAVRTGLTDLGLVRTSDTGQIDPTTVLRATVGATSQGYDIFRFGDALHATAPFYIKLEYGSGAGNAAFAGLWITIGTGTNGAGTLTGNVSTRQAFAITSAADTTARTCLFAGGPNRVAAYLFENAATPSTQTLFFAIERSHADDGSDTGDRVDIALAYPSSQAWFQSVYAVGPIPTFVSIWPSFTPPSGYSGARGTDVGVYPLFSHVSGPLRNPMIGVLTFIAADIVGVQDVPVAMYGTTRTYRTHSDAFSSTAYSRSGGTAAPMVLVS